MMTLLFSLFGCSDNLSVNDKVQGEENDQLLGDSNVFLEDPDISMSAEAQTDSLDTENPIDTGPAIFDSPFEGLLLRQEGDTLNVFHFGADLPCEWTIDEINIGFYGDSVPEPYVGALLAEYGDSGSCSFDLQYAIDLSALGVLFEPGLHIFYAQNEQAAINLTAF